MAMTNSSKKPDNNISGLRTMSDLQSYGPITGNQHS